MKKEKTKVYIYTRVSTAMQIDGYSLDAQKSRMKAFAEYNEYEMANALKVTMDVLLAEYLEQNTAAAGAELSAIIEDCSEYEKRVIIDSARSLKHVLREARHLAQRR